MRKCTHEVDSIDARVLVGTNLNGPSNNSISKLCNAFLGKDSIAQLRGYNHEKHQDQLANFGEEVV